MLYQVEVLTTSQPGSQSPAHNAANGEDGPWFCWFSVAPWPLLVSDSMLTRSDHRLSPGRTGLELRPLRYAVVQIAPDAPESACR